MEINMWLLLLVSAATILLAEMSKAANCPSGLFSIGSNSQCFKFIDVRVTWDQAFARCSSEGLVLARPDDKVAVPLRQHMLDTYGSGYFPWVSARGRGPGSGWSWRSGPGSAAAAAGGGGGGTVTTALVWPGHRQLDDTTRCMRLLVTEWALADHPTTPYGLGTCSVAWPVLCQGIGWGPWSAWTTCSHTCGGGEQTRTRECLGGDCLRTGTDDDTRICNTAHCPVHEEEPRWCKFINIEICDLESTVQTECARTCLKYNKSRSDSASKPSSQVSNSVEEVIPFNEYVSIFTKEYVNEEEKQNRHALFDNSLTVIEEHNKHYDAGKSTYRKGVNQYSDLSYQEYSYKYTGLDEDDDAQRSKRSTLGYYEPIDLNNEPESLDYVTNKTVNPIRDQGTCGSCWAFSAVSAIESQITLKKKVRQRLSEQYLVDCDNTNSGCNGGSRDRVFKYIKENGISLAYGYEYTGKHDSNCISDAPKSTFNVAGTQQVRPNEHELMNALVHVGPITVGIYASSNFQFYKSGVFNDELCEDRKKRNHAMLLVGYGQQLGQKYWLLRNSHNTTWGEQGYMKLLRGTNECGITDHAVFPIIEEGCPPGFIALNGTTECYKILSESLTNYTEASNACSKRGLSLAQPPHKSASALRKLILDKYGVGWTWLGARKETVTSDVMWQHQEKWMKAKTSNSNNRVALERNSSLWDTLFAPEGGVWSTENDLCLVMVIDQESAEERPNQPYGLVPCARANKTKEIFYPLCQGFETRLCCNGEECITTNQPCICDMCKSYPIIEASANWRCTDCGKDDYWNKETGTVVRTWASPKLNLEDISTTSTATPLRNNTETDLLLTQLKCSVLILGLVYYFFN